MCGHIDMKNATTIVSENKKDVQDPECCRRHREKVDRHHVLKMIVQERPPALGRRLGSTNKILGHRCLGDLKAKLEQLTMDARCAPANIRCLHLANKLPKFSVDTGPSHTTALPRPILPKTFPMPSDDRVRMQCKQHRSPFIDIATENHPKEAILVRGACLF